MMDYDRETEELKYICKKTGTHEFDDFIELMPTLSASMKKMHETLDKMKAKQEARDKEKHDLQDGN